MDNRECDPDYWYERLEYREEDEPLLSRDFLETLVSAISIVSLVLVACLIAVVLS